MGLSSRQLGLGHQEMACLQINNTLEAGEARGKWGEVTQGRSHQHSGGSRGN